MARIFDMMQWSDVLVGDGDEILSIRTLYAYLRQTRLESNELHTALAPW